MSDTKSPTDEILDAALPHVPFDGWSQATLAAAIRDAGLDPALGHGLFPRGGVDLALAYHARGDAALAAKMAETDMSGMRIRDKITQAVRWRIEAAGNRDLVRRGAALFALPRWAPDGAKAIWGTADVIWKGLGDTSEDINWYTKRTTLSGVYSATVLYWLGDESEGSAATWDFLDRRIEDVMRFEATKAKLRENKAFSALMAGPNAILSGIRKPPARRDYPGQEHAG